MYRYWQLRKGTKCNDYTIDSPVDSASSFPVRTGLWVSFRCCEGSDRTCCVYCCDIDAWSVVMRLEDRKTAVSPCVSSWDNLDLENTSCEDPDTDKINLGIRFMLALCDTGLFVSDEMEDIVDAFGLGDICDIGDGAWLSDRTDKDVWDCFGDLRLLLGDGWNKPDGHILGNNAESVELDGVSVKVDLSSGEVFG